MQAFDGSALEQVPARRSGVMLVCDAMQDGGDI